MSIPRGGLSALRICLLGPEEGDVGRGADSGSRGTRGSGLPMVGAECQWRGGLGAVAVLAGEGRAWA
jgi:hypothetical protein